MSDLFQNALQQAQVAADSGELAAMLDALAALESCLPESVSDSQHDLTLNAGITDGRLAEADRTRFKLIAKLAGLLEHLPDPLAWARAQSQRLAGFLEQVPVTGAEQSHAPELYRNFALFHARWLAWCVRSGHLEVIPEILAIVQSREIAAEPLDQLQLDDPATPESVRAFHRLRLELRKVNARVEAVINGDKPSGLDGPAGFGRGAQLDTRTWDAAAYNALLAEHRQLTARLAEQRVLAAREPGYESLVLPYQRIVLADLQRCLSTQEVLLLLIDPPEGEAGALLIGPRGEPHWQPLPGLPALAEAMRLLGSRVHDGEAPGQQARLMADLGTFDEAIVRGLSEPELFWDSLAGALRERLWAPLRPHLDKVARVTAVCSGAMHRLPLEAGAPATLRISRCPALVLFFARRGGGPFARATTDAPPSPAVGLIGCADEAGDTTLAEAEVVALGRLYRAQGIPVCHPNGYPHSIEPIGLLHMAGSVIGDPRLPGRVAIPLGDPGRGDPDRPRLLDEASILASPVSPQEVYLSAGFSAVIRDTMSAAPSGLVTAWLRRNARCVVASLVDLPDLWAVLLALLTHQARIIEDLPLPAALAEGKRRLAAGDWFADTGAQMQAALREPLRRLAEAGVAELWDHLAWTCDERDRKDQFAEQAIPALLSGWALTAEEIAELHQSLRHHGPETLAEPLAAALAERWSSQPRIPPQPYLGALIHGFVVFGEGAV